MEDELRIQLENITKKFGDVTAVDGVSFSVKKGEFFTIVGPSGCGKTTTLRMIAGLERPTNGNISINGEVVNNLPPYDRDISMVFQNYALFPHKSVGANIEYGLKIKGVEKAAREQRVEEILDLVNMPGFQDRQPQELSGGQQQRIALARALVLDPSVLLLDEPLSNLDRKLREEMQFELKRIQDDLNITAIYVTHDQEEALSMSDRILVMNEGKSEHLGTPYEIYNQPNNQFVANFVGNSNFIPAEVKSHSNNIFTLEPDLDIDKNNIQISSNNYNFKTGDPVLLCLRPESLTINSMANEDNMNTINGEIRGKTYVGDSVDVLVSVSNQTLQIKMVGDTLQRDYSIGDTVDVSWDYSNGILLEK